jgi:hypothetical protein
MYDCFYFILFYFALSQLLIIFSPKLDTYSCLGKTSFFSHEEFLLYNVNPPPSKRNHPQQFSRTQSWLPLWLYQHATHNCFSVGSIWICRFFTFQRVSASFLLTPGISFFADTYPRSNLHETILLRQAFCALLNDGCLREMVIMIDFEP